MDASFTLNICIVSSLRVYRDQRNGLLKALKQRSLRLSHLDSVQVAAASTGLVCIFSIFQWQLRENVGEGQGSGPEVLLCLGLGEKTRQAYCFPTDWFPPQYIMCLQFGSSLLVI